MNNKRKADALDYEDEDSPLPATPDGSDAEPSGQAPGSSYRYTKRNTDGYSDEEGQAEPGGKPVDIADGNEDEDEENAELEFGKHQAIDPEKMQALLARFTPEQMNRYEHYRRSNFQRATMRRLLQNLAGCPISIPMTIVMSGIAKVFVGELVEMGRVVMSEPKDTGPIRPSHIRQAYRRLKLEGKIPARTRPTLFH